MGLTTVEEAKNAILSAVEEGTVDRTYFLMKRVD